MKWIGVLTLVVFTGIARGQDAPHTLPSNYKVQFENEWVKVTSVRYEPMQKLPAHAHTSHPAAYVYLNDGPAVVFRHLGGPVSRRRPTKAGSFRVDVGRTEVHEVENLGNAPSEFLRIELPTVTVERGDQLSGTFARPAVPSQTPIRHLEHRQFRVSRIWLLPDKETEISTSTDPSLLIPLQTGAGLRRGEARWLSRATVMRLSSAEAAPIDVLRFDFKATLPP